MTVFLGEIQVAKIIPACGQFVIVHNGPSVENYQVRATMDEARQFVEFLVPPECRFFLTFIDDEPNLLGWDKIEGGPEYMPLFPA